MSTRTTEQIGVAIRKRRKELKVTQKDLALTCGTGLRFIIDLEKGKPTCQIGKVLQVVHALGLELRIASIAGGIRDGGDP
jgi:HTH-type transcriptional regulator / antitoxin HipB